VLYVQFLVINLDGIQALFDMVSLIHEAKNQEDLGDDCTLWWIVVVQPLQK